MAASPATVARPEARAAGRPRVSKELFVKETTRLMKSGGTVTLARAKFDGKG